MERDNLAEAEWGATATTIVVSRQGEAVALLAGVAVALGHAATMTVVEAAVGLLP